MKEPKADGWWKIPLLRPGVFQPILSSTGNVVHLYVVIGGLPQCPLIFFSINSGSLLGSDLAVRKCLFALNTQQKIHIKI